MKKYKITLWKNPNNINVNEIGKKRLLWLAYPIIPINNPNIAGNSAPEPIILIATTKALFISTFF